MLRICSRSRIVAPTQQCSWPCVTSPTCSDMFGGSVQLLCKNRTQIHTVPVKVRTNCPKAALDRPDFRSLPIFPVYPFDDPICSINVRHRARVEIDDS